MMDLSNPPVIEATAQLNFQCNSAVPFDQLVDSSKKFALENSLNIQDFELIDGNAKVSNYGLRLSSADSKVIVQYARDLFSYSQVGPYTGWDNFMSQFEAKASIAFSALPISNVTRIALRYINRMEFSTTFEDLGNHLKIYPCWERSLTDRINGAQFILNFPTLNDEATANVMMRLEHKSDDQKVALFDIDVFKVGNFKPDFKSAILPHLLALRDEKNRIFKEGITDGTLKRFK